MKNLLKLNLDSILNKTSIDIFHVCCFLASFSWNELMYYLSGSPKLVDIEPETWMEGSLEPVRW